LHLTPEVLADIFLGKIAKWNDPAIQAVNPGLKLPDRAITVVHRADGSGTTWIFTNYLDKVSPEWHRRWGPKRPSPGRPGWAQGQRGGGRVRAEDLGRHRLLGIRLRHPEPDSHTLLRNRAGKFVAPTIQTFQAAAANADWQHAPGYYLVLTDQPETRVGRLPAPPSSWCTGTRRNRRRRKPCSRSSTGASGTGRRPRKNSTTCPSDECGRDAAEDLAAGGQGQRAAGVAVTRARAARRSATSDPGAGIRPRSHWPCCPVVLAGIRTKTWLCRPHDLRRRSRKPMKMAFRPRWPCRTLQGTGDDE